MTQSTDSVKNVITRRTLLTGVGVGVFATGLSVAPPASAAVNYSQNGWSVLTPGDSRLRQTIVAKDAKAVVRRGQPGTILLYVLRYFDTHVEDLIPSQTGGYSYRRISGSSKWSNHASATALDLNWQKHPQGRRGTFSAAQVRQIRHILSVCEGVVRWGGDYRTTPDEMHFEINVTPSNPLLGKVSRKLGGS